MPEILSDLDALLLVGVDHRLDFCREIVGTEDRPTASERERAASLKKAVFEGLLCAIENGVPKSQSAIWADPDLGEGVLLRARAMSLHAAVSVERPGHGKTDLGDPTKAWDCATRLDAGTLAARIRYNPSDTLLAREVAQERLRSLAEKCRNGGRSLLIEIASTPTARQIEENGGEDTARAVVILETMRQLQDSGVEPSAWAVEPPTNKRAASAIAAQAHLDDRNGIRVLFVVGAEPEPGRGGRGLTRSEREVAEMAARTPGVSGVLVGPGAYYNALLSLHQGHSVQEDAVQSIGKTINEIWAVYLRAAARSEIL